MLDQFHVWSWNILHTKFGADDDFAFAILGYLWNMGLFTFYATLLMIVDHFRLFQRYRIQPGKFPPADIVIESWQAVAKNVVIAFPVQYMLLYVFEFFKFDFSKGAHVPDVWTVLWQLAVLVLLVDTMFYWTHRLLHQPSFYAHHKKHHAFKQPHAPSSVYSDTLEDITNFVTSVLGPAWMLSYVCGGMSVFVYYIWVGLSISETVDAHCGYEFPWSPFAWIGVSRKHDFHHSHNIGCYGAFFYLWDRLLGTDTKFREFEQKRLRVLANKQQN